MEAVFTPMALVKRELIANLRTTRSFGVVLIFVCGLASVILISWPRDAMYMMGMSYASRMMVTQINVFLLLGAGLILPSLAANSIVVEKERGTFDMLHMTLIRPGGVVLGKLLNVLGFYILMSIAILPVLGVVFFLVGVDWVEMLSTFVLLLTFAFATSTAAIFSSALFKKSRQANLGAFLFIAIMVFGPILLMLFVDEYLKIHEAEDIIEALASIMTIKLVVDVKKVGPEYVAAIIYNLGWGLLFFWLSKKMLSRPPKEIKVDLSKPIDDVVVLKDRRRKFPYYLLDPRRRKKAIEDYRNPMAVKEIRWGMWGRASTIVRMFYVALISFFLIGLVSPIPYIVISLLLAPAIVSNAFTKEYEQENLDMLRMTLLTSRQIVFGKLYAGFISISPLIVAAMIAGLVPAIFSISRNMGIEKIVAGYATYLTCIFVSISLGLLASVLTRKTSVSSGLSYALNIGYFIGIPFFLALLHEIAGFSFDKDIIKYVSPVIAFADMGYRTHDYGQLIISTALGLLLSIVLIKVSVVIFTKFHMQDR